MTAPRHDLDSLCFATPSPRLIHEGEKPESFTGLAMVHLMPLKTGGTVHANLFDDLIQLDSKARDELLKKCHGMRLSKEATEGIEQAARLLLEFESGGRKHLISDAALAKKLGDISKKADELRGLIGEIPIFNLYQLHETIVDDMHRKNRVLLLERTVPHDMATAIAQELESLAIAAKEIKSKVAPKGRGGGRLKIYPIYFRILDWIWESVSNEGFSLGRGGKFEQLCDAVFYAAGVHASAAGVVRKFSETKSQRDELEKQTVAVGFAE